MPFFEWLDAHNGSVTALATLVLGIVTIWYVALTRRILKEQQKDRHIQYTPYVAWTMQHPEGDLLPFTAANNSSAAAYHVIVCAVGTGVWYCSAAFDIGPGDTHPPGGEANLDYLVPKATRQAGPAPSAADVLGAKGDTGRALFCESVLGHMIRIRPTTTVVDVWVPRRGRRRGPKPEWVQWYEQALAERVRL